MKDNELENITHQLRELESGKNRRLTPSILTILEASEREIQKQIEQQMQMGNDLLQTELFDQTVRLIKNCDDTCVDIKEEYQKELTVVPQCSDKNLTGIRNALLRLDTETSSVVTAADVTTVDSAGSQEVDDTYESGGVPVGTTTAGEDDSRIVMDGLGVSITSDQDEGHNSVAAGAHSEVEVDGISEVADAGEILLPQQVTSSVAVQVPPLHLVGVHSEGITVRQRVRILRWQLMVYPRLQMLVRSCCHSKLHPRQWYKFHHSICRHSRTVWEFPWRLARTKDITVWQRVRILRWKLMVYPRLQMLVRSCCHSKLHPSQLYKFHHSIWWECIVKDITVWQWVRILR
jgi:hypothetical protein